MNQSPSWFVVAITGLPSAPPPASTAAPCPPRSFDRFGMARTSMLWREDFADNNADGYAEDGSFIEHDQRENVRAAGSMDTTIADWSNFLAGFARGEGLSAGARAELVRLQVAIDSPRQFPTLLPERTDKWQSIRLGYGLGWGVFETPQGHAFFKEGHNESTANYALCIDARQDCVLLMSNSVRAEGIFVELVELLMGPTHLPWEWENYLPYDRQAAGTTTP